MSQFRPLHAAILLGLTTGVGLSAPRTAAPAQAAALGALDGLTSYSRKSPYSDAIADIYLGYNETGGVVRAVALRVFKTYEKVTAMVVVSRQDGAFVVTQTAVPDIAVIKNADKQQKVLDAIKSIAGRTVREKDGTQRNIDATTGATRYYNRIYASYDLMARKAVEAMEGNPDWPRATLAR